jgi:nucleoside-diphosphate-sugar epimerase
MAKENLGWCPSISLAQGLVKTLPYFKSLLRECSRTPEMVVFAR